MPLLVHGGIPGQQHISPHLEKSLDLGIQHLEIGIVHCHIGRSEHPLCSRPAGSQIIGAQKQQGNRDQQRQHHQRNDCDNIDSSVSMFHGKPLPFGFIWVYYTNPYEPCQSFQYPETGKTPSSVKMDAFCYAPFWVYMAESTVLFSGMLGIPPAVSVDRLAAVEA